LVRRAGEAPDAYARRLFEDARFEGLLVDFGFRTDVHFDHAGLAAVVPCPVAPVLRLEALAGALVAETDTFERMVEVYGEQVNTARARGAVALKSVVAYRSGLTVAPPDRQAAKAAFDAVRRTGPAGPVRLTQKPLLDYLLWLGLEAAAAQDLPMQIHTGFGDRDIDLVTANPALLRPLLERHPTAKIILLHGSYPFTRQGAFLASMYRHVYLDLSEVIPYIAGDEQRRVVSEALGLAPVTKLLMATDASKVPDLYYLGARHGRQALAEALGAEVRANRLEADEAQWAAQRILSENARELYLSGG
ncbi:MAG: amidohydrolase family protein, partial [Deinococcus sp.]|nr:amidohydrolase family protein [Deinococcus sp.]